MPTPSSCSTSFVASLAAGVVLAAGGAGASWFSRALPHPHRPTQPMLLAPMMGVVDTCLTLRAAPPSATPEQAALTAQCTGPTGSAAALIESTLKQLHPGSEAAAAYPLGYTLPVPLLQLFRAEGGDWVIDTERVQRVVRTVQGNARPLVLYLFSTHFSAGAPLEAALARNPDNLAATRDGPLPIDSYYGDPVYPWTFARTDTEITTRRVQAAQALLAALCELPDADRAKVRAITLLGELHHLFPDFQAGMGFAPPYRVTDYSAASIQGFQRFLQTQWRDVAQLNRALGSDYADFSAVHAPSRDIRSEPLQRFTEHMDSYAHGSLPVAGWAYTPPGQPAWVHVYRNGVFAGKTPVNQGRQDVLQAKPELGDANTGWRLDLDFRQWPAGLHRLDMFLESAPGQLVALGSRQIAVMDRQQHTPLTQPQRPLPRSAPPPATLQAHIDMPQEQQSFYYNPLAPLWHAFRAQQVVDYLRFFDRQVGRSCFADTPRYTHQILPFANPGWDAPKFAIDASLRDASLGLGVSLYGNAAYGPGFAQWLRSVGRRHYGVTEFHPLKALDGPALRQVLDAHAAQGAQFLSFFLEPYWQGQPVARAHNLFSFDPHNERFGSAQLYQAVRQDLR